MIDRRSFLHGAGIVLLAMPMAAHSQPVGNGPRVGLLFYGAPGPSPELEAFRQGLREVGYIELTPQIYHLARAHFADRRTGTAFEKGNQVGMTLEALLARER